MSIGIFRVSISLALGSVWFNGKIERGKESEWMDPLSTVWNHQQEERKKCFGLGPTAKTFPRWIGWKGGEGTNFV